MKTKTIFVAAAMLLASGNVNAEITTSIESVAGDKIQITKGTECFVRERTLFGAGGASTLSGMFAEEGLAVTDNKKSDCLIVVSAAIRVQHKNNPTATLVSTIVQEDEIMSELGASSNVVEQDVPKSTVGETAGAGVGASFGLAGAVAGAVIGSALDSQKTKYLSADIAGMRADLQFKDTNGKVLKMDVVVNAVSTTKERPVDLLRAAVKRVVAEIQAKQDASSNAGASVPVITNQIH
ncbi:MAG: hypothetical protein HOP24_05445 [Sideroxydans sp.]|nr:hypothetical protein [Sideroxydans sp.]